MMQAKLSESRLAWLAAGTVLGMVIAYYCPSEPAYAETSSMGEKFAMCTVNTAPAASEAVFVLDMVTGRLIGAAYNTTTGTFSLRYARNLAADFGATSKASYVLVSGTANLRTTGGGPPATGVIYVGELNSGLVNMYGFPYMQTTQENAFELVPIAQFPWRTGF